jgi:hypothetical protein
MEDNQELKKIIGDSEKKVLKEAESEFDRAFESWQDFGAFLIKEHPNLVTSWENRKAESVVSVIREAGNSEEACQALLAALKAQNEQAEASYYYELVRSHIVILTAISLEDGSVSEQELVSSVQLVAHTLKISHQEVGELMEPIVKELSVLSEDDRIQQFSDSLARIKASGDEGFMGSCYLQYELVAHSDGLVQREADLLDFIREEWGISDEVSERIRSDPGIRPSKGTAQKGGSGCALFLAAGLLSTWHFLL